MFSYILSILELVMIILLLFWEKLMPIL